MGYEYEHPYPSPELAAQHPFRPLDFVRHDDGEMLARAETFYAELDRRRSVRMFSDEPVPGALIELAVATASTAPSGAHKQPWTFVAIGDPAIKSAIREAAEEEERRCSSGRTASGPLRCFRSGSRSTACSFLTWFASRSTR